MTSPQRVVTSLVFRISGRHQHPIFPFCASTVLTWYQYPVLSSERGRLKAPEYQVEDLKAWHRTALLLYRQALVHFREGGSVGIQLQKAVRGRSGPR